jgi:hypothetical protein
MTFGATPCFNAPHMRLFLGPNAEHAFTSQWCVRPTFAILIGL